MAKGIMNSRLLVLNKLFNAGFKSKKDILGISFDDVDKIPGITRNEILIISKLRKAMRKNMDYEYLCEGKFEEEVQ